MWEPIQVLKGKKNDQGHVMTGSAQNEVCARTISQYGYFPLTITAAVLCGWSCPTCSNVGINTESELKIVQLTPTDCAFRGFLDFTRFTGKERTDFSCTEAGEVAWTGTWTLEEAFVAVMIWPSRWTTWSTLLRKSWTPKNDFSISGLLQESARSMTMAVYVKVPNHFLSCLSL